MFLNDFGNFSGNVLHKTPEGYLTGRICVTGAGVFRYMDNAGKFIGRLRSVDEVKKATASLNGKPVTLLHPSDEVTPENAKKLSVGMSASDASFDDGLNNFVTITITDKAAIDAIERGEVKAISCGYTCDVTDDVGVWQGSPHQQKQTDIAYNHIALVREGRAGDQVRFRVGDSASFGDYFKDFKQEEKNMKTIQIDGVDYQADEKVIQALQDARAELSQAQEDLQTLNDDNDKLREELEEAKLDAELDDDFDEKLQDAIDAKIEVIDIARHFGCEVDACDSAEDIYKAVITKAFDEMDLEGKDASYMNAMFDAACKKLEKDSANEGGKKHTTSLDGFGGGEGEDDPHSIMMDSLYNLDKKEG